MPRKNHPKEVDPLQQEMQGVIGEGAALSGELHLEGGYRVDGRIAGRVNCTGTLIVGPPGYLDTEELHAGSLVVAGEVRGNLIHSIQGHGIYLRASAVEMWRTTSSPISA